MVSHTEWMDSLNYNATPWAPRGSIVGVELTGSAFIASSRKATSDGQQHREITIVEIEKQ
jgi:hypothetical protein